MEGSRAPTGSSAPSHRGRWLPRSSPRGPASRRRDYCPGATAKVVSCAAYVAVVAHFGPATLTVPVISFGFLTVPVKCTVSLTGLPSELARIDWLTLRVLAKP